MQIVEENEQGAGAIQTQVMQFGEVACEDGSLPVPKLVSVIRSSFDVDSNVDIRLYARFGNRLADLYRKADVSWLLRDADGSCQVYFLRR